MDALIQTLLADAECSVDDCNHQASHIITLDNTSKTYCFRHASDEWTKMINENTQNRFISQQPDPIANDEPSIQDLVVKDIQDYKEYGIKKYGMVLQANNGRDPLIDAYQESLALTQYLRQALKEKYDE